MARSTRSKTKATEEDKPSSSQAPPKSVRIHKPSTQTHGKTPGSKSLKAQQEQLASAKTSSPAHRLAEPAKSALKTPTVESLEELDPYLSEDSDEAEEEDLVAGIASDEEEDEQHAKDLETLGQVTKEQLPVFDKKAKHTPGVIFIGRLPRGFEEEQLKTYFEQFGDILRLRLSRNRKSGASKHYAFIEFAHNKVADVVAETMDNYLLTGHILVCKVIPPEQVHPRLWVGANKKFRPMPKNKLVRERHNASKTVEKQKQIATARVKSDNKKRKRLSDLGIDYEFDGYKAPQKEEPVAKRTRRESNGKEEAAAAEDKAKPAKASKKSKKAKAAEEEPKDTGVQIEIDAPAKPKSKGKKAKAKEAPAVPDEAEAPKSKGKDKGKKTKAEESVAKRTRRKSQS